MGSEYDTFQSSGDRITTSERQMRRAEICIAFIYVFRYAYFQAAGFHIRDKAPYLQIQMRGKTWLAVRCGAK